MAASPDATARSTSSRQPHVVCEELVRIYKIADLEVFALQGLDLQVDQGEIMAIVGNSGSGKTTLLNILGGVDRPTAGRASVGGKDLLRLSAAQLLSYRRDDVGFVWQNPSRNLIPYLTVQQNVELPLLLAGRLNAEGRKWAADLVDTVGLSHRRSHHVMELSMGEQQRAAIAIGLSNRPGLILADEPTGSVDDANAEAILEVLHRLSNEFGTTVIIVTHDVRVSRMVDRVVGIRDGRSSVEFLRAESVPSEGMPASPAEHQQYVMVDRAGRLQLPNEVLEALGARRRLRVGLEGERVILAPQEVGPGTTGTTANR
jgi:ABC-type lipoprotein export system ATPase subunit